MWQRSRSVRTFQRGFRRFYTSSMGDTCSVWSFDAYLCPDHRIFGVNDGTSPDEEVTFLQGMPSSQLLFSCWMPSSHFRDARNSWKMPESHQQVLVLVQGYERKIARRASFKMRIPRTSCSVLWMPFPATFICILWPRFVSLQQRKWIQYIYARCCQSICARWVTLLRVCWFRFENKRFKHTKTHICEIPVKWLSVWLCYICML